MRAPLLNSNRGGSPIQMNIPRCFRVLVLAILAVSYSAPTAKSEIIDLDLSGLTQDFGTAGIVQVFREAEQFWDSRVLGYSNNIARDIQPNLNGRLTIVVTEDDGVLGDIGAIAAARTLTTATSVLGGRNRAVATSSEILFSPDTVGDFTTAEFRDIVIHEMGHALGFGTLWTQNDLLELVPRRNGIPQFRGINARRTFADEAGFNVPQVAYVPIELEGGIGTALGHWDDDNFFFNSVNRDNRVELLTGFFIDNTERFVSETTFASLVDIGYVVSGFNEDELINFNIPTRPLFPTTASRNFFPTTTTTLAAISASPTAVPEPSALMLVLAGMSGMLLRRRRKIC